MNRQLKITTEEQTERYTNRKIHQSTFYSDSKAKKYNYIFKRYGE
jgi:hypothetical protein